MKYPKVQSLTSEELINKVKNLPFMEYYDQMIRIMKAEENKLRKDEHIKHKSSLIDHNNGHNQFIENNHNHNSGGGFFSKFTNLFGSTPNHNIKQKTANKGSIGTQNKKVNVENSKEDEQKDNDLQLLSEESFKSVGPISSAIIDKEP